MKLIILSFFALAINMLFANDLTRQKEKWPNSIIENNLQLRGRTMEDNQKPSVSLSEAENFNSNVSLAFEENKGQITGADAVNVKYQLKKGNLSVFLMNNGIAYQFTKAHYPKGYGGLSKLAGSDEINKMIELNKQIRTETYRMDVRLKNANVNPRITAEGKSSDYMQYYNHNALNVHSYSTITYHDVYPNIDWVIYTFGENIKYDFIVRPGGNPSDIQLETNWAEGISLNKDGSVTMKTRMGNIVEKQPISFQNGKAVKTAFKLNNNILSFDLESYDPNATLRIDPLVRLWGTFYGGSQDDRGSACAIDTSGNVYLSGYTKSTSGIAAGGYQNTYSGATYDAYLVKFNSGGIRQWGTYYGGNGASDGLSCEVDAAGNVYLTGYTYSSTLIASGGHQNTYGGNLDAFLVKFNSSGVRQWATYYGGADYDQGSVCFTDSSGNVYLIGYTASTTSIASGGHQVVYGGGSFDAFIVKFNSNGVRLWSSYYGGSDSDGSLGGAVDSSDNVYVAGFTNSTSSIANGGHQNTFGGVRDAFLVKFNTNGVRQWCTYYGGLNDDYSTFCAVDAANNIYLAGVTTSTDAISASGHQNSFGGGTYDAFLVKFNSNGIRQWGTYYGGAANDFGSSCTVDGDGNLYLAGSTESSSSIALSGFQNTYNGNSDLFLVKFSTNGSRQWGTYYGGSAIEDQYPSCITDASGNVYLAGRTASTGSIAAAGHQNAYGGGGFDAFLVKFDNFSVCSPEVTISSNQGSTICNGTQVIFTATGNSAGTTPTYQWKKNGNNVGTGLSTYTTSILADGDVITCELTSNTPCSNITTVSSNTITFTVNPIVTPTISIASNLGNSICEGTSVDLSSTITNGGSNPVYQWRINGINVGTGLSSFLAANLVDGDIVTCELTSNAACASPLNSLSNSITFTVNPIVTPGISIISNQGNTICAGEEVIFSATATNGGDIPSYQWNINGNTVGTDLGTFTTSSLVDGDVVLCQLLSFPTCASNPGATSNSLIMTVTSVNNAITLSGTTLTATQTGATYQWFNCTTVSPVSGATSQMFTPAATGSYQVAVTLNGCTETSTCMSVTIPGNVGLSEEGIATISIYPNPTTSYFIIETGTVTSSIQLIDVTGKIVYSESNVADKQKIDVSNFANGTYSVVITNPNYTTNQRLVILR